MVQGKEWLAARDERTRGTHAAARVQTGGLEEDFDVGGGSGQGPGLIADQIGRAAGRARG